MEPCPRGRKPVATRAATHSDASHPRRATPANCAPQPRSVRRELHQRAGARFAPCASSPRARLGSSFSLLYPSLLAGTSLTARRKAARRWRKDEPLKDGLRQRPADRVPVPCDHLPLVYSVMVSVRKMVMPIGAATCASGRAATRAATPRGFGATMGGGTRAAARVQRGWGVRRVAAWRTATRFRCMPRLMKPIPSCFQSRRVVANTPSSVCAAQCGNA